MAKPTAKQRREWQERVTAMPTAADIANCIECWPTDWQDKFAFHNGQVATLLAEVELRRAREAALVEALDALYQEADIDTVTSETKRQVCALLASAGATEQEA